MVLILPDVYKRQEEKIAREDIQEFLDTLVKGGILTNDGEQNEETV